MAVKRHLTVTVCKRAMRRATAFNNFVDYMYEEADLRATGPVSICSITMSESVQVVTVSLELSDLGQQFPDGVAGPVFRHIQNIPASTG